MSKPVANRQLSVASIRRNGAYLLVEPPGPWLAPFQVVRVGAMVGGRHGYALKPDVVPLFRRVSLGPEQPAVQLFPGLLGPARGSMKMSGYTVETAVSSPAPLESNSAAFAANPSLFRFIEHHDRGILRSDTTRDVNPAQVIAGAALAFPAAKITGIVPSNAQAWQEELRKVVPNVGLSTGRHLYQGGRRVVVATPGALGMVNIGQADIVFVVDPFEKMKNDPLLAVESVEPPQPGTGATIDLMAKLADVRGRLFGFVSRFNQPSRFEAARVAQLFGTAEYVIPWWGGTERTVRVAWSRFDGGSLPAAASGTHLATKEWGIWKNPILNRRVAALARAVSMGSPESLREKFPDLAGCIEPGQTKRVLVLVEGLEHAEAMVTKLAWPIVADTAAGGNKSVLSEPNVIATASGVGRLTADDFDVMIRLDMGVGLPPLPLPGWLDTIESDLAPLVLIDFAARHHPLLRRWTKSRRAAYRLAGWQDLGEDPDIAALNRFVALTAARRATP